MRRQIFKQRRKEAQSDETIAFLEQQNAHYFQEIQRQNEKITQIAESVAAAFREYKDHEWSRSKDKHTGGEPTIEEVIQIYSSL